MTQDITPSTINLLTQALANAAIDQNSLCRTVGTRMVLAQKYKDQNAFDTNYKHLKVLKARLSDSLSALQAAGIDDVMRLIEAGPKKPEPLLPAHIQALLFPEA